MSTRYFLIGKGFVSEDPSKQLNMRKLTGWRDASRGNHINHLAAGVGNFAVWLHSFSNEWLWKWKPHQVITENSQIWYPESLCCNEMSFWICCIHFEHWTTVIICASEESKRSTHGSCAANHTQAAKSWLLIREACTHYSPASLAWTPASQRRYLLHDKNGGRWTGWE